jgi:hypothetical protein
MERSDFEFDMLVKKLDRRKKLFDEERKQYLKEFLMLRELIRRAGLSEESSLWKALEGKHEHSCRCRVCAAL